MPPACEQGSIHGLPPVNPVRSPLRLPPSGVIRGCWQLSEGHSDGWSSERAFAALDAAAAAEHPLVLDCADIYTGVERIIGDWLAGRPDIAGDVAVHTKFVPDLGALSTIDREYVRRVVLRSRDRLGVDALELVQFAWWDLSQPKWVHAAEWLAELRQEGIIRHLGVTNFDRAALGTLLDAGIPVVSSQVQLSLLDRRPLKGLTKLCRERGVTVFAYGALAGGLLSDAGGPPEESRSLTKYRLIVEEVGGREVLGRARGALAELAARHGATMADAAVAYVLRQPGVGAAIVGLSRRGLMVDGRRVHLSPSDVARLEGTVPETVGGEVFEVERDRQGPHGRIMRYNLNLEH
ncbi:MAG: aldo/keto reductase [Gammaproteobacteria bacterium]|nr:aldo/keto reductase [Gammaproteobacteria bacterium]